MILFNIKGMTCALQIYQLSDAVYSKNDWISIDWKIPLDVDPCYVERHTQKKLPFSHPPSPV